MFVLKKLYNYSYIGRCSNGWSSVNGKCLFISTFTLNWTDASAYCKSFAAQLLTFSAAKLYPTFNFSYLSNIVASNTNYFIGLSEQPSDSGKLIISYLNLIFIHHLSGHWQWVDGSSLLSSSLNLFCTNGSIDQFDPIFRTTMNCGIYRMDSCLARYTCQRIDVNFICEKSRIFIYDFHRIDFSYSF